MYLVLTAAGIIKNSDAFAEVVMQTDGQTSTHTEAFGCRNANCIVQCMISVKIWDCTSGRPSSVFTIINLTPSPSSERVSKTYWAGTHQDGQTASRWSLSF